jgi:hypothetical protein
LGAPGGPYILGILPSCGGNEAGKFLGVEVKRPGNKPTPAQRSFLDRINSFGGVGLCVTSIADLEDQQRPQAVGA